MWYAEFQKKYKWLPEHEYQMKKTFASKASDLLSEALYGKKYKWLPEHEYQMKKTFASKASDLLSEALYGVRNKKNNGTWIPQPIRVQLEEIWNTPKWKQRSNKNSDNRRCDGGPLHTGGSIPSIEHGKRLKTSHDVNPSCWDIFQKTHTVKGDCSNWVSEKSRTVATEYE